MPDIKDKLPFLPQVGLFYIGMWVIFTSVLTLEQAGWKIDYWFADIVSGKVPAIKRKAFSEILSKIRDGETLVVAKLDRLGCDAIDALQRSGCWQSVISR